MFVHVLDWPDRMLSLPAFGARVVERDDAERAAAGWTSTQTETGITLTLPEVVGDEPDRVVVLQTRTATSRE